MKTSVLLCVYFITIVAVVQATLEPGLRVRYDLGDGVGSTFFFDIPKNISEAGAEGWIPMVRPKDQMEGLVLHCYPDGIVCGHYDDLGFLVGIQVGIPQHEITDALYDWTVQGFTNWNTTVNGTETSYWATSIFFLSNETLANSQEERLARRLASNETLYEGFVLTTGINKKLMRINSNASDITANQTLFTKQGCVAGMGRHYYYNMSSTTECTSTDMYPWFVMVHCDQTVAVGLSTYGKLPIKSGSRNWFERATSSFVKTTVPNGPQCGYESSEDPGSLTLHIFFYDNPQVITCDTEDCASFD